MMFLKINQMTECKNGQITAFFLTTTLCLGPFQTNINQSSHTFSSYEVMLIHFDNKQNK